MLLQVNDYLVTARKYQSRRITIYPQARHLRAKMKQIKVSTLNYKSVTWEMKIAKLVIKNLIV